MIITKEKDGKIKLTMQEDIDEAFWDEVKRIQSTNEATIKGLKRELQIATDENKYLKFMINKIKEEVYRETTIN